MNELKPKYPQKIIEKAKRLWDSFEPEAQDMRFEDFLAEVASMADPNQMQRDLARIQMVQAQQTSNKIKIDKALARARNSNG